MSANFIVRYAGAGVNFSSDGPGLGDDQHATQFTSEADAWYRAYQSGLSPHKLEVIDLYALNQSVNESTKK